MLDDPGVRQGDVGDGDDDVGGASVMLPAAVSHVVDPLPVVLTNESLVLTRIAVITSGIVTLATIQPPGHPPITLNLSKQCDNDKIIFNKNTNAPLSLSIGYGLDRSDPSTHVDRSECLGPCLVH